MASPHDVDPGDETRRYGDHVGLPHDQDSGGTNDVAEGEVVAVDGSGNIAQADANGDGSAIGVLQEYQYYGDSSGSGPQIKQDRDALVGLQGTYRVRVDSAVVAGDYLTTPDTSATGTAGVLDSDNADDSSNFVALTDAVDDGSGNYYAEVLVR